MLLMLATIRRGVDGRESRRTLIVAQRISLAVRSSMVHTIQRIFSIVRTARQRNSLNVSRPAIACRSVPMPEFAAANLAGRSRRMSSQTANHSAASTPGEKSTTITPSRSGSALLIAADHISAQVTSLTPDPAEQTAGNGMMENQECGIMAVYITPPAFDNYLCMAAGGRWQSSGSRCAGSRQSKNSLDPALVSLCSARAAGDSLFLCEYWPGLNIDTDVLLRLWGFAAISAF